MLIDEATLESTLFPYIGYAAALATVLTFAIQTFRILYTRDVNNLSSYMYIMYCLGAICWFAYGVYLEAWTLAIANLITFVFVFAILCMILYYDAEDKIERERRDPETYLFNMKYFYQAVPEKIGQALALGQNFSVIVLSYANHEDILAEYGKKFTSKSVKQLAKCLDKALRNSDMIARYNDTDFVIYLDNCDNKLAKIVATRLQNEIKKLEFKPQDNTELAFDINFGISDSKSDKKLETIIDNAEKAMKTATTRSRIKVYTEKNK